MVTLSFVLLGVYLLLGAKPIRIEVLAPILLIVCLVYFYVIFYQYRRQLRVLYSVRVKIDGNGITYFELGQKPKRVTKNDFISVEERQHGFWVTSAAHQNGIFLPIGLVSDGDAEVRGLIETWGPLRRLERHKNSVRVKLQWITFTGAAMILLYANHLWIVIALGIFLFAFGTYTEMRLIRVHDVEPGITRLYSASYAFIVFLICVKSCFLGLTMMF